MVFEKMRLRKLFKTPYFLMGASAAALVVSLVTTSVLVSANHSLASNIVLKKDGKRIDSLDVKDILIVPGSSSSYDVSLFSSLSDTYKVYMLVEGVKETLTDLITLSVFNKSINYSVNLSDSFSNGFAYICESYLSLDSGLDLTVQYDFSSSITEDLIKPVDLAITFRIGHQ